MTLAVETRSGGHQQGGRLAGLDLLRLIAALAVVLFHFGYAGPARGTMTTAFPEISSLAKYGYLGVDLFFLISGFVIAASAEGRHASPFAASRLLRLYPAYAAAMTITAAAILTLGGGQVGVTPTQWLANLTMIAPAFGQPFMDGVYWSITVEIVFYGWVAVLIATGLFQRHLLTTLALWLAIAFIDELVLQSRAFRLIVITDYAGLFAAGMLIHRIRKGERGIWTFALLATAFLHGAVHTATGRAAFERIYADTLDSDIQLIAHAGLFLAFAAALAVSKYIPARRAVLTLGGLTYPLYLVHQQAGHLSIDALAPVMGPWLALTAVVTASLALAWLIYTYVEPLGRAAIKLVLATLSQACDIISSQMPFPGRRTGPRRAPVSPG